MKILISLSEVRQGSKHPDYVHVHEIIEWDNPHLPKDGDLIELEDFIPKYNEDESFEGGAYEVGYIVWIKRDGEIIPKIQLIDG